MIEQSRKIAFVLITLVVCSGQAFAQSSDASQQLRNIVSFYRGQVGYEGAYLWRYAADLSRQEGEGEATKTSGWTQPPGTPSVGEAYLKAWQLSGEHACFEAAVEAAHALVRSQLRSGGWSSHFDLGPDGRRKYAYRTDESRSGRNNLTTFDDDKTQSAVMLLMHVDEALKQADGEIHEAVEYALQHILAAQYPNGAWPQQFDQPTTGHADGMRHASYPESWSRTFPDQRYLDFYTLNDGNMSHIVDMLFEAHRIYGREDCRQAALRTGEFFLLAQMPDPQPGWAQQYDAQMHPAWARKFEPASITGGESQGVMKTLMQIYALTGDRRFLEPIPRALAYYRRSTLSDGRLARFYELQTNRPLYFTLDYQLTYSDDNVPTHYAFKVGSQLDAIEKRYQELLATPPERHSSATPASSEPVKRTKRLEEQATELLRSLDDRGAWVESGKMRHTDETLSIIDMRTFVRNLEALASFVGAQ